MDKFIKTIAPYNKTVVAVIGAIITWATANYAGNADVQVWLSLVTAIMTVMGVYQVPNSSKIITRR